MKKHLQRILSLLCVLALVLGTVSALAEDPSVQYDARIITVQWDDGDNYDGLRPAAVKAALAGQEVELKEENGWAAEAAVPSGSKETWAFETPAGYVASRDEGTEILKVTFRHAVAPSVEKSATVAWNDGNNAGAIRPASVQLMLLADGEPYGEPLEAKDPGWKVTWKDLPARKPGAAENINYTVQQLQTPEGYTSSAAGLEVTNSLLTGKLALSVSVTGAPEDADLSGLTITVDGPDPSMPKKFTGSQAGTASYDLGDVLPGAYLVTGSNADELVEGYIMDTANSKVSDAVFVKAGESASLAYQYAFKLPESYEAEEDYDPTANIGNLSFEILGPDDRMPLTVTYALFTDGKYELPDLKPGVYTVVERNAETLVKYYTLTGASVTGMKLEVAADGTATAKLFNQYAPAPTPEPDAEFVDIPVSKVWNDNNDADGNRPASITARLYADGVEVDSHVLTAAENWAYTFMEKPRYQEDHKTEIAYTVNEDAVPMYTATINGYTLVNDYRPEVTSLSVAKVWEDNENEKGYRPDSIAMSLSNGTKVVKVVMLNEENGWTATVNDLPTVINGQPAQYAWSEQSVISYSLKTVKQENNTMIFTNVLWDRPDTPTGGKKPKTTGDTWFIFEEYDTPLGVEVVINHVGDCFD